MAYYRCELGFGEKKVKIKIIFDVELSKRTVVLASKPEGDSISTAAEENQEVLDMVQAVEQTTLSQV